MYSGRRVAGSVEIATNSVWQCFQTLLIQPNIFCFVSFLKLRLLLALFVRNDFVWVGGWGGWVGVMTNYVVQLALNCCQGKIQGQAVTTLLSHHKTTFFFFFGLVWCDIVWFGMVWFDLLSFAMVWFCQVWYGLAWFGWVWFGMVWFGLVFSDHARIFLFSQPKSKMF